MAKTYTEDDLQKYGVGLNEQNVGFAFHTGAPLDDRTVVNTKAALISDNKKGFKDADNKKTWIYPGMTVTVVDPGDIYVLTNYEGLRFYTNSEINTLESQGRLDAEIAKYWTKLPSQDDLQKALDANKKELFTFKGVASAIDEDRCTITVSALKIGSTALTVDKQAYDLGMQTMFHWKGGNYEFWTETSDGTGPRYQATSTSEVNYVKRLDTYYFKTDDEHVWESVNGDKIYESSGNYYTDAAHKNQIAVTTGQHTVYTFEQDTDTLSITYAGSIQTANSGNIGHVYQIGEEEYASNGSIWVQLGSPKEDWIVIK